MQQARKLSGNHAAKNVHIMCRVTSEPAQIRNTIPKQYAKVKDFGSINMNEGVLRLKVFYREIESIQVNEHESIASCFYFIVFKWI